MAATAEEKAAYAALDEPDRARVNPLMEQGRDPTMALQSVVAQVKAATDKPTLGQNAKAFAANAANAFTPDTTNAGLGLTAAVLPASLPVMGAIRVARDAMGVDEALERVSQDAPGGALAGALGGGAASVALGGKGAGVGRGAKAAGVADDVASNAPRVAKEAAKEAALGFAENAGAKLIGERGVERVKSLFKGKAKDSRPAWHTGLLDDIEPGKAEPSGLDLATPATGPRSFLRFLDDEAPAPARSGADMPADVMAGGSPSPRAAAVEQLLAEDVAPLAKPSQFPSAAQETAKLSPAELSKKMGMPIPPPVKKPPGIDEVEAAAGEPTRRWFESLPLAKAPTPSVPLSTAQLRAAARAAVEAGESLGDLAARLGLNKTDRELVAVFKAAQIGN